MWEGKDYHLFAYRLRKSELSRSSFLHKIIYPFSRM